MQREKKVRTGRASNLPSSMRSGLNSFTSSPHSFGSRWVLYVTMIRMSPGFTAYLPPMTVSSIGVTVRAGAVVPRRRPSRMTAERGESDVRVGRMVWGI